MSIKQDLAGVLLHVSRILLAIKLLSLKRKKNKKKFSIFLSLVDWTAGIVWSTFFKVIVRQRNVIESSPAWDLFRTYFEYWVLHQYSSMGMWTRIGSHVNEIIDRRINSGIDHNKLGRSPANITMSHNNELQMCQESQKNYPGMTHLPLLLLSSIIIFYNFLEHWLLLFHLNQFIPKYQIIW